MKTLKFYDVKKRKSFTSNKYRLTTRKVKGKTKYFAVAKAPSKIEAWRVVSKETYLDNK